MSEERYRGESGWGRSGQYQGGQGDRRQQGGTQRGFQGGPSSQAIGRWGSGSGSFGGGEEADYGHQRYAGSYGLGYGGRRRGGQQDESFGERLGRFFGKGPKGYQRSDERIKEQVSDKLEENGEIDASEITVEVKQGEVTLEGSVSDRWMKRMAEDVAEDCAGVKQVHNRLRVENGQGGSSTRSALLGGSSSGSTASSGSTQETGSTSEKNPRSRSGS
jgi:hypothetical protein